MKDMLDEIIESINALNDGFKESRNIMTDEEIQAEISEIIPMVISEIEKHVVTIENVLAGTSDLPKTQQELIKIRLEEQIKEPFEDRVKLFTNFARLIKASDEDNGFNFLVPMMTQILEMLMNILKKVQPELTERYDELFSNLKGILNDNRN